MKKLVFLLIICLIGCSSSSREDFLKNLHDETQDPYKDCVTNYVREHWAEVWKTYEKEKIREPRGEADVIHDITSKYTSMCRLQNSP